jgi:hypothetical protein
MMIKLNIGLASLNEIIAGMGYKKVCVLRLPYQFTSEMKTASISVAALLLQKGG